jgi:hypothetical protein
MLEAFSKLCRDARHEVRHHAMNFLQRSLLSPELMAITPNAYNYCFGQVCVCHSTLIGACRCVQANLTVLLVAW